MLDLLWRARTIDPVVVIILALAALSVAAIAAIPLAPRKKDGHSRRHAAIRWSLVVLTAPLAYVGLSNGWDRMGRRPEGIYVLRRGADIRIAVAGDSGQRGSVCFVRTSTLDRRLVGRARKSASRCQVGDVAAWADGGASMRPIDLWAGEFGPTLRELASEQGPLPGSGELQFLGMGKGGASVRLQDGTTRSVLMPSTEGVLRLSINEEPLAVAIPGVHDATLVQHDCCENASCGPLLSFSDVAFGSGSLHLGLLRAAPETSDPQELAWSMATRDIFGTEAAVTGAFRLDDEDLCVAVAGLPGYRVGVAFLDVEDGTVVRRAIH
jgi:hypothetical protein